MPNLFIIFLTILFLQTSFAQENEKFRFGEEFQSVFQDYIQGEFSGTTNGVLFIKSQDKQEMILDFQGSYGMLQIEDDPDEVYDISTKIYHGKTTSGKTEIKYQTYASANSFGIKLNGQWFELSALDGASDMEINGLDYSYKSEASTEYLVLRVERALELSNWGYLKRVERTTNLNNLEKLREKEKSITLLPASTLVFAIQRPPTDSNISTIKQIFEEYVKWQESIDTEDNKNLMQKSLEALTTINTAKDFALLIDVWLYYDPTDFPARELVYRVLKENKPESLAAIKRRQVTRKEWEQIDSAPFAELNQLLAELEKEEK